MDKATLAVLFQSVVQLFAKNKGKILEEVTKAASKEVAKPVPQIQMETVLDWNNPKSKIAKYFTVQDAIILREWKRLGNESDGLNDTVKANLVEVFKKMDIIRELLGKPVFIKSAWRPSAYNVAIGGAKQSAHMANAEYAAVDFWCDQDGDGDKDGEDCDAIKALLMPKLEELGIRMEDNGKGARWVHIDTRPVPKGGNRFFKP